MNKIIGFNAYKEQGKIEAGIERGIIIESKKYEAVSYTHLDVYKRQGFCDMETILSKDGLETVLAFKSENQKISVLQTFWMDEFDEDILEKMTDLFREKTEKKVGKRKIGNYIVQLIQCVCVGRMNEQAMDYVHRNLFQNIRQYQSISVIAFEESQVYICQTDNKLSLIHI